MEKIGTWAFLIGVVIAVVAGLIPAFSQPPLAGQVAWVLVILGLVVGFLNIRAKEAQEFLVACIAILVVAGMGGLPPLGRTLGAILTNLIAFVAPAALLVALRAVWALAEE
ncbi:MAG: hypothetical protein QXT19_03915 [Candidatus Woesearchaeota archaeon]